jgi:hypothetical protein
MSSLGWSIVHLLGAMHRDVTCACWMEWFTGLQFCVRQQHSVNCHIEINVSFLCMLYKISANNSHPLNRFLVRFVPYTITKLAVVNLSCRFEVLRCHTEQFRCCLFPNINLAVAEQSVQVCL